MVGILGTFVVSYIRGPLASSVRIQRHNEAETRLSMGMQLAAVASATRQANNGDCDGDGYIEPIPYRAAGAAPYPTGGGLIPLTIGAAKADPWQRDIGYCTFDHGPTVDDAACGGPTQARQMGANANTLPALALVSAGPDGVFQTVCNDFADANLDGLPDAPLVDTPTTSDDIAYAWTYAEAAGGADGLWQIEAGDASTAEIDRNLSVKDGGGVEQFSFDAQTASLALGAGGSGSFPTIKTDYFDALTMPAIEVLAPINATEPLSMNGTEIIDASGLIVYGEQDPTITDIQQDKWCKGAAGGIVECNANLPAPAVGQTIYRAAREDLLGKNEVDFVPASGVERLSIHVVGMSTASGTSPVVQLSCGGSVRTTGYLGTAALLTVSSVSDTNLSNGFQIRSGPAARVVHGSVSLALVDPATNSWAASGTFGASDTSVQYFVAGSVALPCPVDGVRLSGNGGPFDAGYALATWE